MRFLLLNQTFHPDVMATGQYLNEVALGLVERGHEVTVVCSRRAYDHPETIFPKHETWRGIRIIRIGSTGFGKTAKWRRAADFASFLALCTLRLFFLPRPDVVVALTSPPLISFLGAWVAKLRRARFFYWVMDFNPDEAIAAGWLAERSLAAKVLDRMSRFSLNRSAKIIALDRFMRDRIAAKGVPPDKIVVLPPWSHDDDARFNPAGRDRFRQAHGLEQKFVVMYSGNHSPVHPLDTVLRAADRLRDHPDILFLFVGGGTEWRKIQARSSWSADRGQGISDIGRRTSDLGQGTGDRSQASRATSQESRVAGHPPLATRHPPLGSHSPPATRHPPPATGGHLSALALPRSADFQSAVSQDCILQARQGAGDREQETGVRSQESGDTSQAPRVTSHESRVAGHAPPATRDSSPSHLRTFSLSHPSPATPELSTLNSQLSTNISCLPYQPWSELSASLSAADLHLVVMGNPFVGLVHPCKIYNILGVAAPVLYIGPDPSHVTEILSTLGPDYPSASVRHGDVDSAVQAIRRLRDLHLSSQSRPTPTAHRPFSKAALLPQLLALLTSP